MLKQKHLLGLEGYPAEDIQTIIDTAFNFREVLERPIKKVPSLSLRKGLFLLIIFRIFKKIFEDYFHGLREKITLNFSSYCFL